MDIISKHFHSQSQFCVTVLSNSSEKTYPNNLLNCFTNILHMPLNFCANESWQVALTEIYINDCDTYRTEKYKKLPSSFINDSLYVAANTITEAQKINYDFTDIYTNENNEVFVRLKSNQKQMYDLPIFVYTNIITPRLIGDQISKVCKIIYSNGKKCLIKMSSLEFYPIETCRINEISIALKDEEGKFVEFQASPVPTMVTFLFKRL